MGKIILSEKLKKIVEGKPFEIFEIFFFNKIFKK
jgi:hypothetical protein